MLDLRQRLFFLFGIGALLIVGGILIMIALQRTDTPPISVDQTPGVEDPSVEQPPDVFDPTLTLNPVIGDPSAMGAGLANEDETARFVRHQAITFVERFLSYSNQTRNQHISDILPLATAEMAAWLRTQEIPYSDTYAGSTTHVIVSRVETLEATTASVHIEAQQRLESQQDTQYLQHVGRVDLIQNQGQWYIDGLYWD